MGASESYAEFTVEPDEEGPIEPGIFTHSPDFRSVTLGKESFELTPNQAAVIRILFEAHQSGNSVIGLVHLCDTAGFSEKLRLRDVFKNNVIAYNALIQQGKRKGTYRLNIEEKK